MGFFEGFIKTAVSQSWVAKHLRKGYRSRDKKNGLTKLIKDPYYKRLYSAATDRSANHLAKQLFRPTKIERSSARNMLRYENIRTKPGQSPSEYKEKVKAHLDGTEGLRHKFQEWSKKHKRDDQW